MQQTYQPRKSELLIFILVGLLWGCGLGSPPPLPSFPRQRSTDTLILGRTGNPQSFDPAGAGGVFDGALVSLIHSGVVRFNPAGEIVPDLAAAWEICPEGLVYTFHLRNDARYSNGDPVHAEDVLASWSRVASPTRNSFLSWVFSPIAGYQDFRAGVSSSLSGLRAIDHRTLEMRLSEPFAPMLSRLAMPCATVAHPTTVAELGNNYTHNPVGSGPWILESYVNDDHVKLASNGFSHHCQPILLHILYRIIPEPFAMVAELEVGGLDSIEDLPIAERLRWSASPQWQSQMYALPGLNIYFLGMNNTRPPFNDVRARQAIAMAVNVDGFIAGPLAGGVVRAHGPIPPGLLGYRPELSPLPYDPGQARQLWESAPGTENYTLELWYVDFDDFMGPLAESIHSDLTKIGINTKVMLKESSVFRQARAARELDFYVGNWVADYPDTENFFYPLFHSENAEKGVNYSGYANPELDTIIEQAQQTTDTAQRVRLYEQAEDIVRLESPWVFLWHRVDYQVDAPWLKNFPHPMMFNGATYCETSIEL